MNLDNIEAILFDSGKVLNYPKTGHWFKSPMFFSYIQKNTFENISNKKRTIAFTKASNYINSINFIQTKEEEYEHFKKFYEIFSNELPELNLDNDNISKLANDLVYNNEKYTFYDDAIDLIPSLNKKYKLAIVSDAWPSLKDIFINAGLYSYFSSFVISSEQGVSKPNEKMYLVALNELKIKANKAIFIDDNINNCLGAKKIGINSILLCRDKKYFILHKFISIGKGYKVINTLNDLLDLF